MEALLDTVMALALVTAGLMCVAGIVGSVRLITTAIKDWIKG